MAWLKWFLSIVHIKWWIVLSGVTLTIIGWNIGSTVLHFILIVSMTIITIYCLILPADQFEYVVFTPFRWLKERISYTNWCIKKWWSERPKGKR